jgi:hypothetical protein
MGACPNIKFAQLLSFKKLGKSLYGLADSNKKNTSREQFSIPHLLC